MNKFRLAGALFLLVAGLALGAEAQTDQESAAFRVVNRYAPAAFALVRKMSPALLRSIGFDNPAEVLSARLGEPFFDYFIPLDRLVRYAGGGRPETMLEPTHQVLFPILSAGVTKSSLTMAPSGGGYVLGPLGPSGLARALDQARTANHGLPPKSVFIVRIPALGIVLIGHRPSPGALLLGRVRKDTPSGDQPGVLQPADAVLLPLVPLARKVDPRAPS